jgi:hypothetical protein
MYDIKVLNNKCKLGGGDVSPQCFVKDGKGNAMF